MMLYIHQPIIIKDIKGKLQPEKLFTTEEPLIFPMNGGVMFAFVWLNVIFSLIKSFHKLKQGFDLFFILISHGTCWHAKCWHKRKKVLSLCFLALISQLKMYIRCQEHGKVLIFIHFMFWWVCTTKTWYTS